MLFVPCTVAHATDLYGKVIAVADGDTITLLDAENREHKVRLAGIDAPERGQPYGERAKQHLASLAFGRSARVIWVKRDRYNRIVGRVLVAECEHPSCRYSIDVALEQVRAGLTWHYKRFEREQAPEERARYAAAEYDARTRRHGLWQEAGAVAPWEFRRRDSARGRASPVTAVPHAHPTASPGTAR